jgi:hypothetical protein
LIVRRFSIATMTPLPRRSELPTAVVPVKLAFQTVRADLS